MQEAMEKQIDNAMFSGNPIQDVLQDMQNPNANPMATRSEVSYNLTEDQHTEREYQHEQRELMNMGMGMDANSRKIESKDQMWKPAPIIQQRMQQQEDYQSEQQLSITQKLAKLREEALQQS